MGNYKKQEQKEQVFSMVVSYLESSEAKKNKKDALKKMDHFFNMLSPVHKKVLSLTKKALDKEVKLIKKKKSSESAMTRNLIMLRNELIKKVAEQEKIAKEEAAKKENVESAPEEVVAKTTEEDNEQGK